MNIQTIIDKFDKEFPELNELITANPYSSYSRKNDVKQFLKDSLTSMLDGISKNLPKDHNADTALYRQEVEKLINSHR